MGQIDHRLLSAFPATFCLVHESWDTLELYALGRSSAAALARIEEHLLICVDCQQALEQVETYVDLLRRGLVELEGLIELHSTSSGVVALRVYQVGPAWVGRVSGADLDTGVSARTRDGAAKRCRTVFRELFPDHDCGPSCKTF